MTEEHEDLHRDLEREADDLQKAQDQLGEKVAETRADWESHKRSQSVPGAEDKPGGLEGVAERARDDDGAEDEA